MLGCTSGYIDFSKKNSHCGIRASLDVQGKSNFRQLFWSISDRGRGTQKAKENRLK
jgi:hypothetical protein